MPYAGTPWVKQGQLMTTDDLPILVDTPAWFGWLDTATHFCYSAPHTTFRLTARKEKRRHKHYWYGYLKHGSKLHTIYLGKSAVLTQARLDGTLTKLAEKALRRNKQ